MSKPSKQLGALLGRVPPATAGHLSSQSLAYAPETTRANAPPATARAAAEQQEVPLQVLLPLHVRIQLDRMHAETRKPLRALTLEALRAIGIEVSEEDIAGKRGKKKAINS